MKSISFFTLPLLTLQLVLQPATAQQFDPLLTTQGAGAYFRFGMGAAFLDDGKLTHFDGPTDSRMEYSTAFAFDGAVGYAFNKYFAADFEFGFLSTEIESVEGFALGDTFLYNAPFLVNFTFSCPIPRTIVTPYLGAGAGGSVTGFDTDYFTDGNVTLYGTDEDVVFAWQVFAGLRFNLNDQMSLGIAYKYFAAEDASLAEAPGLELEFDGMRAHSVLVTFSMKF